MRLLIILLLFTAPALADEFPNTPKSFAVAERLLYEVVYAGHHVDLYCGCGYSDQRRIDVSSCGIARRNNAKRAFRIEAEHIVPAQWIGEGRSCWREPEQFDQCTTRSGRQLSGRECCAKVDPVFRRAYTDLQNLAPAAGELNGDRSDRRYGMVEGEPRAYGNCDFEVDFDTDRAEPSPSVRGLVARASLYMSQIYHLRMSDQQRALFTAWDRQYPPDAWERERNARIKAIQGAGNPFVEAR